MVMQELRCSLNSIIGKIDLKSKDAHAVGSLFKSYLRELPEPIFTKDMNEGAAAMLSNFISSRSPKQSICNRLIYIHHRLRTRSRSVARVSTHHKKSSCSKLCTLQILGCFPSPCCSTQ